MAERKRHDLAWSRILVVEGTSGVGKSTLCDALMRRYAKEPRLRSFLRLTQAHTYGPLAPGEDDGTLTAAECLAHQRAVVGVIDWHARALVDETRPKFFCLVDTLHLTHCFRPGLMRWAEARATDEALAALGARLLLLRARPRTVWERGIAPRLDRDFITGYARKFGDTPEAIHAYFVREQAQMESLFEESRMPRLAIDIDGPLDDYVNRAFSFWINE